MLVNFLSTDRSKKKKEKDIFLTSKKRYSANLIEYFHIFCDEILFLLLYCSEDFLIKTLRKKKSLNRLLNSILIRDNQKFNQNLKKKVAKRAKPLKQNFSFLIDFILIESILM